MNINLRRDVVLLYLLGKHTSGAEKITSDLFRNFLIFFVFISRANWKNADVRIWIRRTKGFSGLCEESSEEGALELGLSVARELTQIRPHFGVFIVYRRVAAWIWLQVFHLYLLLVLTQVFLFSASVQQRGLKSDQWPKFSKCARGRFTVKSVYSIFRGRK